MSRSRAGVRVTLAMVLLAAVVLPAAGQDAASGSPQMGQNVLVTLTISKTGGDTAPPRVFKLLGQHDSEAMMMVGWRTPIPMVSAPKDDPGKAPVTSYVYQNVGVNAKLTIRVLDQGKIHLRGGIEISGAREGHVADGQQAPLIGTFQQTLSVVVADGKKVRIAEAPDPEGGTVSLEIEASVQK